MVAAAPLNDAIAVPVEAVPSAITAEVVAPAAAKPPAVPATAPPNPPIKTPAPTETSRNSSAVYSGSFISSFEYFSNSGLPCMFSIKSANSSKLLKIDNSVLPTLSICFVVFLLFSSNLLIALLCIRFADSIVSFASFIFIPPLIPEPTPATAAAAAIPPKINGNGINLSPCS